MRTLKEKTQLEILDALLHTTTLTADELAKKTSCSNKTIRTYLNDSIDFLEQFHIQLLAQPGKGYHLQYNHQSYIALSHYIKENMSRQTMINSSERVYYILYKLLRFSYPQRMSSLESTLYASRSSLYNDLKKVNIFLANYQLSLIIDRKTGISICEGEKRRRDALCTLMEKLHSEHISMFYEECNSFVKECFSNTATNRKIIALLTKFEIKNHIKIAKKDIESLRLKFYITIERIQQHATVTFNSDDKTRISEFSFIRKMDISISLLSSYFHITFSDEEVCYISSLFLTLKNTNTEIVNLPEVQEQTNTIIQRFSALIYETYCINDEKQFEYGLSYHLSNILEKSSFYYNHHNPLTKQIKEEFPIPYQLASQLLPIVAEVTDILLPEDEISYVALHIASAIEKSIPTLKAIFLYEHRFSELKFSLSLIEAHIKEVEILKKVRYQELASLQHISYQIIFSTFEIPPQEGVHIYVIPVIPDKQFITILRDSLRSLFIQHETILD